MVPRLGRRAENLYTALVLTRQSSRPLNRNERKSREPTQSLAQSKLLRLGCRKTCMSHRRTIVSSSSPEPVPPSSNILSQSHRFSFESKPRFLYSASCSIRNRREIWCREPAVAADAKISPITDHWMFRFFELLCDLGGIIVLFVVIFVFHHRRLGQSAEFSVGS